MWWTDRSMMEEGGRKLIVNKWPSIYFCLFYMHKETHTLHLFSLLFLHFLLILTSLLIHPSHWSQISLWSRHTSPASQLSCELLYLCEFTHIDSFAQCALPALTPDFFNIQLKTCLLHEAFFVQSIQNWIFPPRT